MTYPDKIIVKPQKEKGCAVVVVSAADELAKPRQEHTSVCKVASPRR
jgi:hypothetical protein